MVKIDFSDPLFWAIIIIMVILFCLVLTYFQTDGFTYFPPATNVTVGVMLFSWKVT